MSRAATCLVCSGCGASPAADDPYPFRCPNAGPRDIGMDDVDHVLVRLLDPGVLHFPAGDEAEPFVRYRTLLHSYHRAIAGGISDAGFVELVSELDAAVAAVDGRGFRVTPFGRDPFLSDRLGFNSTGGVWVKDETRNVSGSHKGRHLMGVLLHLEVSERIGLCDPRHRPDLAIASCGNAALAAAVLAAAADRRLQVFVPVVADPVIVGRLRHLGADVVVCPRTAVSAGDPTYAQLRTALAAGAIPFTCQGNENGLVIEGGGTMGYEIVSSLTAGATTIDHLVVQVGGGALASSCIQAVGDAVALGALARLPRIHTVQTTGAHPLERAYRRVLGLMRDERIDVDSALHAAATHRSAYMWPWEDEPRSIATGILDDETYDWRAVVGGMLRSGGRPVVVTEERLAQAHDLGHAAGYPVCPTGTAGLAGLIDLMAAGQVTPDQRVVVLFTGQQRTGG